MRPKLSIKSSLASLVSEQRQALLKDLTTAERALLAYTWEAWARPSQLPPSGDWRIWLFLAGRGAGKTRAVGAPARRAARRHAHRPGGADRGRCA